MRPLPWLAGGLAGVGLVFGTAIWGSSALTLRRVEVAGNRWVSPHDLVGASGLHAGARLLEVSTGRVATRVESLPWIRDGRVERILPSTIRITVAERKPVAVLLIGDSRFIADPEGVVVDRVANDLPETPLISITDLPVSKLAAGRRIRLPQYQQALTVVRSLPDLVRARLVIVRAPSPSRITLELDEGVSVIYGADRQLREKNFALRALMERLRREDKKIASIDVRVPSRPTVRLR